MTDKNEILVNDFEDWKHVSLSIGDSRDNIDIEINDGDVEFDVEIDLCYGSATKLFRIPLDKLKEMINKYEEITR